VVRTLDPHEGLVELMVPPDYQDEIGEILKDLAQEFPIQEVTSAARVIARDSCAESG
jgi:hypothetical protein